MQDGDELIVRKRIVGLFMDWKRQAQILFDLPKPAYFGNPKHCCECAEHEETLSSADVSSIGLEQLGNPGWDPLCFSSPEGLMYYMPALIRLTVDTIDNPREFYLDQMLFHLIKDGPGNSLVSACDERQRKFIADFLAFLIENHSASIDAGMVAEEIVRAHEIWSAAIS